jgi:hypothetical protein
VPPGVIRETIPKGGQLPNTGGPDPLPGIVVVAATLTLLVASLGVGLLVVRSQR